MLFIDVLRTEERVERYAVDGGLQTTQSNDRETFGCHTEYGGHPEQHEFGTAQVKDGQLKWVCGKWH